MAVADQFVSDRCALYQGDAAEVLAGLPSSSVHFSVYSPPFGGLLYQYSSDPADLSNTRDYAEFFAQYDFIIREVHRLTLPGRMTAVHAQVISETKGDEPSIIDFPADVARAHVRCRKPDCTADPLLRERGWCRHGWFVQCAEYNVWKEPLTVRNRTMVKSLHHKTLCLDSTRCSIANADKLLVFRRQGKNAVPVDHPRGLTRYAGSRQPPPEVLKWRGYKGDQIKNEYSQWVWRQYASSFWDDVRLDRTLGSGASLYSANRADKGEPDEKHMHPLQLDVIERAIVLWSNPGEVVLTPFMGVGSEVVGAITAEGPRLGIGVELKKEYFAQAVDNVRKAIEDAAKGDQEELFPTAALANGSPQTELLSSPTPAPETAPAAVRLRATYGDDE